MSTLRSAWYKVMSKPGKLTPNEETVLYAYELVLKGKLTPEEALDALKDLRIL